MKEILIFVIISLLILSHTFAQNIPVIENKSKVIAKIKGVILKDFPKGELILEILESKSIEGYKNFAKKGEIIIASFLPKDIYLSLCYFLKPEDEISAVLEFVGDERKRMWIIREIEVKEEMAKERIEEILKYYLLARGIIKENEEFKYKIRNFYSGIYELEINIQDKSIKLLIDFLGRIIE